VKRIHFNLLRTYLDEIIINQGVIRVPNPERVVDKVRVDFLVKLAFRLYRKLYSEDIPSSYMNRWEWFRCSNCESPCDEFLNYMADPDQVQRFPSVCTLGRDTLTQLECLNCGKRFSSRKPAEEGLYMSLCDDCQNAIGQEIEIWQRLFGTA